MQRIMNRLNGRQFGLIDADSGDINQPVLEAEIAAIRLLDFPAQIKASEFVVDVLPSVGEQVIALYGRSYRMTNQRVNYLRVAAKNRSKVSTLIGIILKQG